jgi:hypothetical protein
MRNSYEMPAVFELGRTKEQILGSKPIVVDEFDGSWGMHRRTEPLPDDIDESDD